MSRSTINKIYEDLPVIEIEDAQGMPSSRELNPIKLFRSRSSINNSVNKDEVITTTNIPLPNKKKVSRLDLTAALNENADLKTESIFANNAIREFQRKRTKEDESEFIDAYGKTTPSQLKRYNSKMSYKPEGVTEHVQNIGEGEFRVKVTRDI